MALFGVALLVVLAAVGWGTGWFGLKSEGPLAVTQVPSTLPARGVQLDDGYIVLRRWKNAPPQAISAGAAIAAARRSSPHPDLAVNALKAAVSVPNGWPIGSIEGSLRSRTVGHMPVWLVTYTSPRPIDASGGGLIPFYVTQFSEAIDPVSGKLLFGFETPYPCRYANPGSGLEACDHPHTVQWLSKLLLDDGDPTVLRTEGFVDLGRNPETVTTVRGNFKLRRAICRAPKPIYQRPCGPVPTASYAWLVGDGGYYAVTTKSQLDAIDSARRANPLFNVFPDFTSSSVLCRIPGVGDAACRTKVVAPRTIEFQARWPVSVPAGTHPSTGGWIIALDRHGHVRSTRQFGDRPS